MRERVEETTELIGAISRVGNDDDGYIAKWWKKMATYV